MTNNNWTLSLCSSLRRKIGTALSRWHMISEGDNVLVGLSGGKDSMILLHALHDFSRRSPVKFSLSALSVKLSGMDTLPLADYCSHLGIPYTVIEQDIISIINPPAPSAQTCGAESSALGLPRTDSASSH